MRGGPNGSLTDKMESAGQRGEGCVCVGGVVGVVAGNGEVSAPSKGNRKCKRHSSEREVHGCSENSGS